MARLARREGLPNQVCFHAQQCCEKMLKALVVAGQMPPPRTHKMVDLLQFSVGPMPKALEERLLLLDRFYIPTAIPTHCRVHSTPACPRRRMATKPWVLPRPAPTG